MTTARLIDGYAADEQSASAIGPRGCILPSKPLFGEIGIAAVAGALAALRPNGAGICINPPSLHHLQKEAGGADASPENLSYELSIT